MSKTDGLESVLCAAFALLTVAGLFALAGQAAATTLEPGDIVVADYRGGAPGRLVKVDPVTGAQSLITDGGLLDEPRGLAYHPGDGHLYVTDMPPNAPHEIIAVDPGDGSQRLVASGLVSPLDLTVDAAGDLLVAAQHFQGSGAIFRIDPETGSQTILAQGGHLNAPSDVALSAAGDLYVTSLASFGRLYVVKIDPVTLEQTVVSPPQLNAWYSNLLYDDATGNLYVAELYTYNGIIAVDGATGVQTILCSGWPFSDPYGLDWDLDGNLIVGDFRNRVIRVDPATGAATILASGNLLMNPAGVAVVREPTPLEVVIDVKPGSDPNAVNPRSRGLIPVAILSTSTAAGEAVDFDAWDADPGSVAFGPGAAAIVHANGHAEDVDGDGDLDMVLHFATPETGLACGDGEASLTGETLEGQDLEGRDAILTVGCGKP